MANMNPLAFIDPYGLESASGSGNWWSGPGSGDIGGPSGPGSGSEGGVISRGIGYVQNALASVGSGIWKGASFIGNAAGDATTFVAGGARKIIQTQAVDIMATLHGSVYGQFFSKTGILSSSLKVVKSLVTLDINGLGRSFGHLSDSVVPRYGRYAGSAWGNALRGRTTTGDPYANSVDNGAFSHDAGYMRSYDPSLPAGMGNQIRNQADFQFIRDMWSGAQPGLYGQIYRLMATPLFYIKGGL